MKPFKWRLMAGLVILTGCSGGPPPRIYVLSPPADAVTSRTAEDPRPVLELRTVSLLDYLDTTDILLRDGRNELRTSPTGRWGERLSTAIADAVRTSLSRRLPAVQLTRAPIPGPPNRELLIDVEAFDIQTDGHCVLTARWTVLGDDRRASGLSGRGTFVTTAPVTASGIADAAIVTAMDQAVEQLAGRIARTLTRGPEGRR